MVDQGKCKFTAKANVVQVGGASTVLIVNNQKGNWHITSYDACTSKAL